MGHSFNAVATTCKIGGCLAIAPGGTAEYDSENSESADFIHVVDAMLFEEEQVIDLFGEISGFAFDDDFSPERLFVGVFDRNYRGMTEFRLSSLTFPSALDLMDSKVVDHCKYLMGHTNVVTCAKFLYSGNFVASASFDNFIKVWEVDSARCVRTFRGHTSAIKSIALSKKSPLIISGSYDQTLRLWDIKSSEQVGSFAVHSDKINSVVLCNSEQRVVSAGDDKVLKVIDLATGELVAGLKGHTNSVKCLNWNESRGLLASASADNSIRVWDLASQRCIKTFTGHKYWVNSVVWGEDFLASGSGDHTVKIWSMTAGGLSATITGHQRFVNCVEWAPERNMLITGGHDSKVMLWRGGTWELDNTYDAHSSEVTGITWDSRFQLFASCSADRSIKLWDCLSSATLKEIEGGRQTCGPVVWLDESTLAVALRGNSLGFFDVNSNSFTKVGKHSNDNITCLAYTAVQKLLVVGTADNCVTFIDPTTNSAAHNFNVNSKPITAVDFSADGLTLAAASQDGVLTLIDTNKAFKQSAFREPISSLKWVDDNTLALVQSNGTITILNTDFEVLRRTNWPDMQLTSVEWAASLDCLAVGDSKGTLKILNPSTLEVHLDLLGHRDYIGCLLWVDSECCLISGSDDQTVRLWDGRTGDCIFIYEGHNFPIRGLTLQRSKGLLAVSLELLTLWELSWSRLKAFLWVVRSWRLSPLLVREIARFI
jgi:WD40 repeat protein